MKTPRSRRARELELEAPEAPPADRAADTGWTTSRSTGATANLTALLRWGMWVLLMAGPLLGTWALLAPSAAPVTAASRAPAAGPAQGRDAVGPAGFAEQFVLAYLDAGDGAEESLARFYPAARGMTWPAGASGQHAQAASAVQVRPVSDGYWSVTVAARVTATASAGAALRYFQVPVRAGDRPGDRSLTAAALPAEVAAPATGPAPELAYGPARAALPSDPAATTLQAFFAAYLTGGPAGQLDRYLAPGTALGPVRPAPYRAVKVTQYAEQGHGPADGAAAQRPPDGVTRQLLVDVTADTAQAKARPLTYAIELRSRAGRWEIAALQGSPALASPDPTTSASPRSSKGLRS
ncbi:conjugal transfer protein [Streptomyces chrestomyceticus]|uniref:conjugal transfer protein n=1 Tax=Streptomyces chrestomyceticus TaxID=68185 RepID=UPI0036ADC964